MTKITNLKQAVRTQLMAVRVGVSVPLTDESGNGSCYILSVVFDDGTDMHVELSSEQADAIEQTVRLNRRVSKEVSRQR